MVLVGWRLLQLRCGLLPLRVRLRLFPVQYQLLAQPVLRRIRQLLLCPRVWPGSCCGGCGSCGGGCGSSCGSCCGFLVLQLGMLRIGSCGGGCGVASCGGPVVRVVGWPADRVVAAPSGCGVIGSSGCGATTAGSRRKPRPIPEGEFQPRTPTIRTRRRGLNERSPKPDFADVGQRPGIGGPSAAGADADPGTGRYSRDRAGDGAQAGSDTAAER